MVEQDGEALYIYGSEVEPSTFYGEGSRMRDVHINAGTLYAILNDTDGRGNPSEADERLLEIPLE